MNKEDLLEIGFEEIPHFTIGDSIIYNLKRNKFISISCVGTPNEMVFLCERDKDDPRCINDLIAIRNFDYDGYTSLDWIKNLIQLLK